MCVIRWSPAVMPLQTLVLPVGQQAFVEYVEPVAHTDGAEVVVYTADVAEAQTYPSREAATYEASRLGAGEVLSLAAVLAGEVAPVLVPEDIGDEEDGQ